MTSRSEVAWCGVDLGSAGNPGGIAVITKELGSGASVFDLDSNGRVIFTILETFGVRHLQIEQPIILGNLTSKRAHGAMREQLGYVLCARDIYSSDEVPCSFELVKPSIWMKEIFKGTKRKPGVEGKRQSMEKAKQLFPSTSPRTFDQAEALLIAEYGRRVHG